MNAPDPDDKSTAGEEKHTKPKAAKTDEASSPSTPNFRAFVAANKAYMAGAGVKPRPARV